MEKKAIVAISGGVDSSVAAIKMLKTGYKVEGITMLVGTENDSNIVADAKMVAKQLNIEHHVFEIKNLFKTSVVDYFCDAYEKGLTPNPCVMCNKKIKFSWLWQKAIDLGADYFVTGHYARIIYDKVQNKYCLAKAKNLAKDQSYFLFYLNQDILAKTLFPLGDFASKDEVRDIAKKSRLKTALSKDSQDICFIPSGQYRKFLANKSEKIKNNLEPEGDFIDVSGKILGRHKGISNYTIGQRKGLGLALGYPAYVVDISYEQNQVVVGKDEDLFSDTMFVHKNNFINIEDVENNQEIMVKIRYKADPVAAKIIFKDEDKIDSVVKIEFSEPVKSVAPGQAAVYYDNDIVLGGGIICKSLKNK